MPACRFRPNPQVDKETSPKSKLDADGSVGSKFKSDGKVCQAILHMCIWSTQADAGCSRAIQLC